MKWIKRVLTITVLLMLLWVVGSLVSHQWKKPVADFDSNLKVMTYNTQALCRDNKQQALKMLSYINQQDADVVCLQEVKVYKSSHRISLAELRHAMRKYPYTYYDFKVYNSKRQFGNVVFSKYPLINKHTVPYQSRNNISSCCDMVVGGDTIRLIVNHLESYKLIKKDLQFDTLSVDHIKNSSLNQKLKSAGALRHEQSKAVKREIRQSPYPVVVVGDFNAIPLSYVYWKIRFGLQDCFLAGSFGKLGSTYQRGPLGIRIDYILCSRKLTPIKCEVDRVTYSDHFPVIATMGW